MRATLLVVAGGLLVGVLGLELVTRVQEAVRCQDRPGSVTMRDPFFGWGHRPGASGWMQGCLGDVAEWRSFVRINARGLHDREIPYERTTARRILVLGDSFTEAFQVGFGASFAKRLERALNTPDPPGTRVEVVNAGASAWGTDNALLFFLREGRRYRADLVVLAFDTGNDVFENSRELLTSVQLYPDKPFFRLVDGRLVRSHYPLPPPMLGQRVAVALYRILEPYSAVVRRLARVSWVWRYLQAPPPPAPGVDPAHPWQVYLREYPRHWRDAWRVTRGLVLRLRQAVEADGARFAVVILNGREEVSPARMQTAVARHPDLASGVDADKPDRLITRFLQRRGIPAIPLLAAFRAEFAADGRPGFFDWDIHWNDAGHALAARVIERGFAEQGLLDAPAPPLRQGGP